MWCWYFTFTFNYVFCNLIGRQNFGSRYKCWYRFVTRPSRVALGSGLARLNEGCIEKGVVDEVCLIKGRESRDAGCNLFSFQPCSNNVTCMDAKLHIEARQKRSTTPEA